MPSKPVRTLEIGAKPEETINTGSQSDTNTAETAQSTEGNKTIIIVAINLLTLGLATISASMFFEKNILFSGWYRVAIFAIAIMCLIAWEKGTVSTEIAKKISITFCVIALFMTAITAICPNFNIKELGVKKNTVSAETQIPVEISQGWTVNNEGGLVANLQQGEEAIKVFRIPEEGYSTPWIILPPEGYRFRFDHLQTIIVEEKGRGKVIVHPDDHYNMGVSQGEYVHIRFTALKGGAEIVTTLRKI